MVLGVNALRARLSRPVDAASLGLFRIALGVMGMLAAVRFFTHGWIDKYYTEPRYFFSYWGLSWVRPWPPPWMHVHYAVIFVAALAVAAGVWTRAACAVLAVTFGYAHFCDQTNWLNHYYLFTLLAALGTVLPLDRFAALRGDPRVTAPTWALWLVRFQLGVVYVFGALGKIGSDWLAYGQPLRIWLAANAELLGPWVHRRSAALVFSWAGFLFDLTIVGFLSWRRTRALAFVVLVTFHVLTSVLFRIGLFPWMMIAFAPVFFEPSWPRRGAAPPAEPGAPLGHVALGLLGAYALVQILVPLRSQLYPGNTLWSEEGFRFSWKGHADREGRRSGARGRGPQRRAQRDRRTGTPWPHPAPHGEHAAGHDLAVCTLRGRRVRGARPGPRARVRALAGHVQRPPARTADRSRA